MIDYELWVYYSRRCAEGDYSCLTPEQSIQIRNYHHIQYNQLLATEDALKLVDNVIYTSYMRTVVGDHGPYIEFAEEQLACHLIVQPGQEYRMTPKFIKNVKYLWMTPDFGALKIYKQLKKVSYADYLPSMYYVCPFELINFLKTYDTKAYDTRRRV